ncbi:hypothetical protein IKQ19_17740 [Candidatus Saccharibacteria bacterium]|nr:hypothetical protein [Candidatus Saccharibacteria bacterium]
MAGYIFSVAKEAWNNVIAENITYGHFSPYCPEIKEFNDDGKRPTDRQKSAINKILTATFGDLVTMKEGDNIYFLSDRKIYGVGVTKKIGSDCKYDNYIGASAITPDYEFDVSSATVLTTPSSRARWVCFFEPAKHFFKKGVDMDDVLQFRSNAFKMLRAFEGLSFIKIDDEENRALREYICLKNEFAYSNIKSHSFEFDNSKHKSLISMNLSPHKMNIINAMRRNDFSTTIYSEMFVESILLQHLSEQQEIPLGKWDYVSHQIIASPFKPLKYIDKIDIFGYRFSGHYNGSPKLITKYLLVELKKDKINKAALEQTMQYVDWICKEYASGDYSLIEAYVVGRSTVRSINEDKKEICQRAFISSSHPATPQKWNDLHVITYDLSNTCISFSELNDE